MGSKVIYKWGPLTGLNHITARGRIIHAEYCDVGLFTSQKGIYVWTEIDNDHWENFNLYYVATGESYDGICHKTVVMPGGLVWHVVETK